MMTLKEIKAQNRKQVRGELKAIEKMLHVPERKVNGHNIEHSHNRWWIYFTCPTANNKCIRIGLSRGHVLWYVYNDSKNFYKNAYLDDLTMED